MTSAPPRPSRQALPLSRISLRDTERGLLAGGTESGKSTLADLLGAEFVKRYSARRARRLILDSKPRYRAQWTADGRSAAGRYRRWSHGRMIPGSVVVDDPRDLKLAWQTGARTVIVQCESGRDIGRLVLATKLFLDDSRASRPQLLQVDETLDFFHGNGAARGGDDAIQRAARAGRERGTACLFCTQRTKGLPVTLLAEMTRLYAMRLDYRADAKRFQEFGAPPFDTPLDEHVFMYWWKGDYRNVHGPYRLDLRA
jgi:hypothetical protein